MKLLRQQTIFTFVLVLTLSFCLTKAYSSKVLNGFLLYDSDTTSNVPAGKDIPVGDRWKVGGNGSLAFSQGYLSYWAEGGESSVSTLSVLSLFGKYKYDKQQWDNTLNVKYGLLKSGEKSFRKNEDLIELNTKYGFRAFKNYYYSLMLGAKTQIDNGFEYPKDSAVLVSGFFAPASLVVALGMDYKPNDNFSLMLSPLTSKTTYVLRNSIDETKYGLEEGERSKKEMGAYLKTLLKWDISKDIQFENKLDFFTNYINKPENIDVNWEVNIAMKINKYLSTTINTHLIYDDDILIPVERTRVGETGLEEVYTAKTKKIQFKEVLGVGLSYKF